MSPTPALKHDPGSAEIRRADPRLHPRYPIKLDLQYKLISGGRVQHLGCGRTLNMSSGGILFEADDFREVTNILRDSGAIELVLDWPLVLREVCLLKLVVRGRIVRQDTERLALRIEQHEFRTAGHTGRRSLPKTTELGVSKV